MRTVLYILLSAVLRGTGWEFCAAAASLVYDSTCDTFLTQNAGNSLLYVCYSNYSSIFKAAQKSHNCKKDYLTCDTDYI